MWGGGARNALWVGGGASTSAKVQCQSDRPFDRRGVLIAALQMEGLGRKKRRLRHEARPRTTVHLRRVNQKRMAEIDRACVSGSKDLRPRRGFRKSVRRKLAQRQSVIAGRRQNARAPAPTSGRSATTVSSRTSSRSRTKSPKPSSRQSSRNFMRRRISALSANRRTAWMHGTS